MSFLFSFYLHLRTGPSQSSVTPKASPSPLNAATSPTQLLLGIPIKENHHSYHLTIIPGVGIAVTAVALILLMVLIFLIRGKTKELDDTKSVDKTTSKSYPPQRPIQKIQDGIATNLICVQL